MENGQIKKIFEELKNKIKNGDPCCSYYRTNKLNQTKGITLFINKVEEEAKKEKAFFEIISASVKNIIPCKYKNNYNTDIEILEEKAFFGFEYVGFIYNDIYFYIDLNDNPFFDNGYSKINFQEENGTKFYTGQLWKSDFNFFEGVENLYNYESKAPEQIAENIFKAFKYGQFSHISQKKGYKHKLERHIYFNV